MSKTTPAPALVPLALAAALGATSAEAAVTQGNRGDCAEIQQVIDQALAEANAATDGLFDTLVDGLDLSERVNQCLKSLFQPRFSAFLGVPSTQDVIDSLSDQACKLVQNTVNEAVGDLGVNAGLSGPFGLNAGVDAGLGTPSGGSTGGYQGLSYSYGASATGKVFNNGWNGGSSWISAPPTVQQTALAGSQSAQIASGDAYSYRFTVPQDASAGQIRFSTNDGISKLVTLSRSPGDFTQALAKADGQSGAINWTVQQLQPGQTYYVNVRSATAAAPMNDTCPSGATCSYQLDSQILRNRGFTGGNQ